MARAARLPLVVACIALTLPALLSAPARAAAPKVVVTLWTWRPEAPVVGRMVAAIALAHPDIDLRAVVQPYDTYFKALRAAAAAGTLPDIVGLPPGAETQRVLAQLQPLSKSVPDIIGKKWRQHFSDEVLDEATLGNPKGDDTLYMLPMTTEVRSLWFDRAVFAKAGLSAAPATLSEMTSDAAKLHAAGVTPLALGGGTDAVLIGLFLEVAAQTDPADLVAAEGGQPVWTHPAMLQAATAWQHVVGAAGADAMTTDAPTAAAQFKQGHAGMSPQGSGWLHQFRISGGPKLSEYGAFAFPAVGSGGKSNPPLGGIAVGWAITKNADGSPDVERASQAVLHELIVGGGAQQAVNALSGMPAYDDLAPQGSIPADVRQLYDAFRKQLGTAKPDVIGNPAIHDALATHLRGVAAGHETPAQAMAAVDAVARTQSLLGP